MKWKLGIVAIMAAAATTLAGQSQNAIPKDDAYVSTYVPTPQGGGPDNPTKDDPTARLEDMRERMGGDLSPEFMEALMAAADEQRTQYGPDGRGAIQVPPGGPWTNIGPHRSQLRSSSDAQRATIEHLLYDGVRSLMRPVKERSPTVIESSLPLLAKI